MTQPTIYIAVVSDGSGLCVALSQWITQNLISYGKNYSENNLFYETMLTYPFMIDTLDYSIRKPLDSNVNWIVEKFLRTDCTHLLLLDDDLVPDSKLLERLVRHDKHIVAGNVLIWRPEFEGPMSCAARKVGDKYVYLDTLKQNNDQFADVDFVGFGCALIRRDVLEKMSKPYFKRIFDINGNMVKGMDLHFCERAKKMGCTIAVDTVEYCGQIVELDLKEVLGKMDNLVTKAYNKGVSDRNS